MTPNLNTALAKAKAEFPKILASKSVEIPTKTGRKINFTYAELEEILPAVTPTLSAHGLAIAHQLQFIGERYCLVSSLRHESGEQIESFFPLPQSFDDPKELGNKITYGRRYSTLCLLDIVAADDGNQDEKKRKFVRDIQQESGMNSKPAPISQQESFLMATADYPRAKINPKAPEVDSRLLISEIQSLARRKNLDVSKLEGGAVKYFNKSFSQLSGKELIQYRDRLSLYAST